MSYRCFVKISWVRNTTLDKFKFDYHTPTVEEIEKQMKQWMLN